MFSNPLIFVAIAAVSLIMYGFFKRLGLGYAFRIATLGVALLMWYGAAGSVSAMVGQVKEAGQSVAQWGSDTWGDTKEKNPAKNIDPEAGGGNSENPPAEESPGDAP